MTQSIDSPSVLLVSLRDASDPMAEHEARCFARHLGIERSQVAVHAMPTGQPTVEGYDLVLFGGSGAYSVLDHPDVPWIRAAIDLLVEVVDKRVPAWASCFGFQGLALALGGEVNRDPARQELGSIWMRTTPDGQQDKVFSHLPGEGFWAQQGHQDHVDRLPTGVVRMATGDQIANQALKVTEAPFWAAQFHPELTVRSTMHRAEYYGERYMTPVERDAVLARMSAGADTPEVGTLLAHLLAHVRAGGR